MCVRVRKWQVKYMRWRIKQVISNTPSCSIKGLSDLEQYFSYSLFYLVLIRLQLEYTNKRSVMIKTVVKYVVISLTRQKFKL